MAAYKLAEAVTGDLRRIYAYGLERWGAVALRDRPGYSRLDLVRLGASSALDASQLAANVYPSRSITGCKMGMMGTSCAK